MVTGLMTHSIQKPNYIRPIILLGRPVRNYTAKSAAQVGSWFDQHHDDSHVYKFNKNRYSSFQNTNLDNYLRERRIDEVWIAGVCTDICVLHTAISAYNLDYHIVIPQAAVATFSPAGAEWAMNHFKNVLGATIR